MAEFPRGWTLTSLAVAGSAASVTVSATAGVVHVLDSYVASLANVAAAAAAMSSAVQVTSAAGTITTSLMIGAGGGLNAIDRDALSGLDIASSVGGTIVVAFQAVAIAGYDELLVIQGHDI